MTRDAAVPITDDALRPIADRVQGGGRSHDLIGIGSLADLANRAKNGDRVFFAANQHINPTNICVLRNVCTFCSFARTPTEEGAYTRTVAEVLAEASRAKSAPTKEFHIVGGLHPRLPLRYYTDMIRALRDAHAGVHIKALTAVEIAHLARIEKTSILEVLLVLKDAGLTSLPGGGAEDFGTAVRASIADRKLAGEEWMAVHRQAHALGIPSNCTMLYGHVETARDRAEHLLLLRALQDESGGFLTYWVTMGLRIGQVALRFGANDFGSVMMEENVVSAAGTTYRTSVEEMEALIRGAGFTPVRRRQDYSLIREAA